MKNLRSIFVQSVYVYKARASNSPYLRLISPRTKCKKDKCVDPNKDVKR